MPLLKKFVEVEVNGGMIDVPEAIEILSSTMCKRTERLLDALRSDVSRPESVRKSADKAYRKSFAKHDLGKRLQKMNVGSLQQIIITEEAATHAPIDPAYEESYFKAVRICLDQESKKSDLKEALRLLEDLHAKMPDNPAVSNNYASALSRLGYMDEAIEVSRECFVKHPEYVFGAANYLGTLLFAKEIDETRAFVDNYRLPQRIHPDAYVAWCSVQMRYYAIVGDEERYRNVQDGVERIQKGFGRKQG